MERVELAFEFLKSLEAEFVFKKVPTLEPINCYLDYFERPELSYKNRVIVTGTAGKGTTCRAIEKVLLDNDVSTLTLYSPHIQSVLERVRISGNLIDKEFFSEILLSIKDAIEVVKVRISYYECLVLLGIIAGAKKGCEVLICEVGLGGDFDATNAISGSRYSVLTFIDLDHTHVLGDRVEKIAEKKLGIVTKDTIKFFTYEQRLKDFFIKKSVIEPTFFEFEDNFNEQLGMKVAEEILGVKVVNIPEIRLPCRFEKVFSNVILDGAHSVARFRNVAEKIKNISGRKVAVIGMLESHDMKDLKIVLDLFDEVIWTKLDKFIRPYYDPKFLQEFFGIGQVNYDCVDAVSKFEGKDNITVFVLGSFYLAGVVREKYISTEYIEKSGCEFLD